MWGLKEEDLKGGFDGRLSKEGLGGGRRGGGGTGGNHCFLLAQVHN